MSFKIACREARKSKHAKHKVGAVIVKGDRVLSCGFNSLRFSSIINQPTLHAEAHAILKLLKEHRLNDLAGSSLYVTRFTKGGNTGLSKPCKNCMELIKSVGVRKVYYSTKESTEVMDV